MKKSNNTFGEPYAIKAIYQKEDGFWTNVRNLALVFNKDKKIIV